VEEFFVEFDEVTAVRESAFFYVGDIFKKSCSSSGRRRPLPRRLLPLVI